MSQMRQFDWVTEDQIAKGNGEKKKYTKAFFADGEASFCISEIRDGYTAAGKPKTMFILDIVDSSGRTGKFTVHAPKDAAWMFLNIFNAIGTGIYRKGGYCDDDVLNKNGKLVFEDEHSEKYGMQSKVVKWLPYDGKNENNPFKAGLPKAAKDDWKDFQGTAPTEVEFDDIPF